MAASKAPKLTAANIVKEVEGAVNLWSLGDELWIPESTRNDIAQRHSDHRGQLEALITLWLEGSSSLTWRGVISTLESMWKYETAYSIRQYAEPLAVPRLTAANVLKEVEGVGDSWRFGNWLCIPYSTLTDIEQRHTDDRERLEAVIIQWLKVDPSPTWRRVITTLDEMSRLGFEDSISQNAEPLADPTLTFDAVLTAVAPVRDLKQLGENLGVPLTIRRERRYDKKSLVYHWLRYCPVVSWGKLAGELYHLKEKESLQLIQRYLKKTTEPTLTLPNLCQALAEVEDWYGLGRLLCVPVSKLYKIKAKYPDSAEAKRQMLDRFLTSHPAPSWRGVFEGLYRMGKRDVKYHTILQDVRRRYGRDLPIIFSDLLLRILDSKELDEQRSTVSSADTPLAVHFRHHPQDGTFSALITFLLSRDNRYPSPWELHLADVAPTCLYRNCVKFTIPECAGSVTLINSSDFFEAHVSTPGPRLRFFLRDAIFAGAAAVLKCEMESAIICPCEAGDTHTATIGADLKMWICSKNPDKWGELQPKHMKWFESTGSEQPSPSRFCVQVEEKCDEIIEFLLKNAVTPEGFATKLESVGLIRFDVREEAELPTVPKSKRMRTVMDAVISRLKLKEENIDEFKSVLEEFGMLEDIIQIIN